MPKWAVEFLGTNARQEHGAFCFLSRSIIRIPSRAMSWNCNRLLQSWDSYGQHSTAQPKPRLKTDLLSVYVCWTCNTHVHTRNYQPNTWLAGFVGVCQDKILKWALCSHPSNNDVMFWARRQFVQISLRHVNLPVRFHKSLHRWEPCWWVPNWQKLLRC